MENATVDFRDTAMMEDNRVKVADVLDHLRAARVRFRDGDGCWCALQAGKDGFSLFTFQPGTTLDIQIDELPSAVDDVRGKRQKLVFHGPDVIDKIVEQIREHPAVLPELGELESFIEQTPSEDLRLPVSEDFYGRLCAASIAERVFRVAEAGENWLRSTLLAYYILHPPLADGSEDSYHHYWDLLIYDPIHTFLGGFVRNTRNKAGAITYGSLRSDVTYYVDNFALLKAEEKGLETQGDPASELLKKDFGLYFSSLPYILGYWARGPLVTVCALYRLTGSEKTSRRDLKHLDLRIPDHRIRMLVICLQFSKLLSVLKKICVEAGVEPDTIHERSNGKVVELFGSIAKKIYKDYARGKLVMSIYGAINDCPYVEKMLHASVEKRYMVFSRGINKQPLNERELVECLSCILQALVYIHSHNIISCIGTFGGRTLSWPAQATHGC